MPHGSFMELIEAARSGDRLISFPTDTVPALAIRPDRAELIFQVKQRSLTKPLILMGSEVADLWQYVTGSPEEHQIWQRIAERYLPGALTLVLPASDRLPPAINPTDPTTVGIRVPNHPIARHLLSHTQPLATTSINRSGDPPLETLAAINQQFPEILTLNLTEVEHLILPSPGDRLPAPGIPSTVVKWSNDRWEILRQGGVEFEG